MDRPAHIGFIVDGNRRWARERGLPTLEGHRRGLKKVELIIEGIAKEHISFTSFYLFSTENWNRSKEEVTYLMDLLRKNLSSITEKLNKLNLKLILLGSENPIPKDLYAGLKSAEKATAPNSAGTICFCFNYGGRQEIIDAANAAAKDGIVTAESLSAHLYHPEVPDCDLIVRTSGEERISGFMLWRAAYSEFLFLDKYWPDITSQDLSNILAEYSTRSRRFGK